MKSVYDIEEKIQELEIQAAQAFRMGDWENGNHYSAQTMVLKWALEDPEKKTIIEFKDITHP